MTEYDPPLGSLPDQDHDHDVLLVAGSRPEVARLAPVATAFDDVDRIRAVTVATGPDPMAVHEAFEALGVPADVTQLLREPFDPVNPASIGAMLMTRLDELLVDLDPSAIMVYGGGMTAAIAAQVAFWRQIPVVHLQAGVASDDLLCPFPQEANRRIIGQLASLFLTTGGAALGSPIGPNAIPVGDTMAANPQPADLRFARLLRRVRAERAAHRAGRRWTGSIRWACSPGSPTCSTASRTSRSCCSASWPRTVPRTRSRATRAAPSCATCRSPISWRCWASAPCWSPTTPSWSATRRASARPPCSSTARSSPSRATRSAASSARP